MKQLLLSVGFLSAFWLRPGFAADATPPAAATPPPPASAIAKPVPVSTAPRVLVVTSMGNFTIELNPERAPLTVPHFLAYVDQGHYTNTIFHRVVADFVIQGGGFDTDYKIKPAPLKIFNESGNGLSNTRATVGMARAQEPHGADAQFYVNLGDNPALDPNLTRWGYAVFGKVVSGMEVVDRIANVPTGAHGIMKAEAPLKPVIILKIERIPSS
jgi:cyclophilin family peptidyl-prolyl cis-trans isomerase